MSHSEHADATARSSRETRAAGWPRSLPYTLKVSVGPLGDDHGASHVIGGPVGGRSPKAPLLDMRRSAGKIGHELLTAFESLGDNCEFGMLQRQHQLEPMSLLRFSAIDVNGDIRVGRLVSALAQKFAGLGALETLSVELAGEPGAREFVVRDSLFDLVCHTSMQEDAISMEELRIRESKRIKFLRLKLLNDLENGKKIWVWKSCDTPHEAYIRPLRRVLRSFGPNKLLWVVEADRAHPHGSAEQIDRDLVKGYVHRFAPYTDAGAIHTASWLEVCQRAHDLFHPEQPYTADPIPAAMRT